jgi:hypothetical protein
MIVILEDEESLSELTDEGSFGSDCWLLSADGVAGGATNVGGGRADADFVRRRVDVVSESSGRFRRSLDGFPIGQFRRQFEFAAHNILPHLYRRWSWRICNNDVIYRPLLKVKRDNRDREKEKEREGFTVQREGYLN